MKKKPATISFDKLHEKWMKDPKYRYEYEKLGPEFEIARQILEARTERKISQAELANRMKTGQAVISRLENANAKPSLALIQRLADALNLKVELKFTPRT